MRKKRNTNAQNTNSQKHMALRHIFSGKSSDELKQAFKSIKTKTQDFNKTYNNKLSELNGSELLSALKQYESIQTDIEKIQSYIDLRDLTVEKKQNWVKNTQKKLTNITRDLVFFKSEIFALPEYDLLDRIVEEPKLSTYTPWLRKQRSYSGNTLPTNEELYIYDQLHTHHSLKSIWAELASPLNLSPSDFIAKLTNENDKKIRHNTFKDIAEETQNNIDMLLQLLHSRLHTNQTWAELRGFESPEQAFITQSQTPDTIIQHIDDDLQEPLAHITAQFYRRKAQKTAKPHLHPADALYISKPKLRKDSWSKIVLPKLQSMLPLKEQNVKILEQCKLDNSSSATPFNVLSSEDITICLNDIPDTMTQIIYMAHGMGKAVQEVHAKSKNTFLSKQPLPAFEKTAGYFAEYIAIDALLIEAKSSKDKQAIIEFQLERNLQTLSLHTALITFNQSINDSLQKNGAISDTDAEKLWKTTLQETFGPTIDYDVEGLGTLWAEWPAMFSDLSSAYQDVIGMTLATKLYQEYSESNDKTAFLESYHEFLGSGQSKQGKALLKTVNIDIEDSKMWQQSLKFIENRFTKLTELDKKLNASNDSNPKRGM